MTFMHRELASGRWNDMSIIEQMANIGSEVERALKWKTKGNSEYCAKAFERALELIDLTLASPRNEHRLKEVARTREVLVDYFYGDNQCNSSPKSFQSYFLQFACAARR